MMNAVRAVGRELNAAAPSGKTFKKIVILFVEFIYFLNFCLVNLFGSVIYVHFVNKNFMNSLSCPGGILYHIVL